MEPFLRCIQNPDQSICTYNSPMLDRTVRERGEPEVRLFVRDFATAAGTLKCFSSMFLDFHGSQEQYKCVYTKEPRPNKQ